MGWIEKLNGGPHLIGLGAGTAEVLYWAYTPHLPDNTPHRHTYFEVCQVGAYGYGQFLVEGDAYELTPGDLFIARPGALHQIVNTARPDMELSWISFMWAPGEGSPTGELGILLHTFASSAVLVVPDEAKRVSSLWQALRVVVEEGPRPGYETQLEHLVTSLLIAISQVGTGSKPSHPEIPHRHDSGAVKVRLARRYIHDNLDRRLPVPEISAHVHLSPRQLSRLFIQHQGVPPAAYVEEARLERAKDLLLHTSNPIKALAATVGYESVHAFSRAFARRFGLPPGAARRAGGRDGANGQERGG